MDSVKMHLALTHVPVILSLVGLTMLVISLLKKNETLTKTSHSFLLFSGMAAIPVFLSGEGSEKMVGRLPGVSKTIIERHEELADLAMISIAAAGVVALVALVVQKWAAGAKIFKVLLLFLAVVSGWLMFQTADLGGQIRHTEIRNSTILQNGNETGGEKSGRSNALPAGEDD